MPDDDELDEKLYTGPDRRSHLADAAADLNTSVADLTASVRDLAGYGRRNRRLIYWTAGGLLVDLILSVTLILVAVQANNASHRATEATSAAAQNRQNARVTCESGNQARLAQIQLWTYVLDVSAQSSPDPTPEQKKRIADFRAYISRVFTPRDCNNPGSPAVPRPTGPPTR
jgi:hypothetical protein